MQEKISEIRIYLLDKFGAACYFEIRKYEFRREGAIVKITLQAARVNRGLLQAEAASRLRISTKTLSNWEKGRSYPRSAQLVELCRLYGVALGDLILLK